MGDSCNKSMVKLIAQKGRGSCNLVMVKTEDLKRKVNTSLMQAFEPSLQACELTLAGEKISLGEVFRNQNLTRCKIISRAEFESLTFSFKYRDPITENQIDYSFIQGDFKKVKNAGLFHFAKYVNTATMHKAVDIGIYKTDSLQFYPRERY
jgi:hypothetical protein